MFLSALMMFSMQVLPRSEHRADFFWGVASSAFQVEGSPADSDWRSWTHQIHKIKDDTDAEMATDFWNRYNEDFKLTQNLKGANSYRLSIAWERIEPRKNEWDETALSHYEKMIEALRARGLEPIVTLNHFVLPEWLAQEGGFLSPEFAGEFAAYAFKVVDRLSRPPAKVQWWITFNEPTVVANAAYLLGIWPPGIKDDISKAMHALALMAEAHIEAVKKFSHHPDLKLRWGIAHHIRDFQPKTTSLLNQCSSRLLDWMFNRQFLDSLNGSIFFYAPPFALVRKNIRNIPATGTLDFIGVNYYGRSLVSFTLSPPFVKIEEGPGTKTDIGWEIYPEGLQHVLTSIYSRYQKPLVITENGIADSKDSQRAQFMDDHLEAMSKAQASGVNVIGYLYWSLTDNFEWAEGLSPRFGLVEIDYAHKARRRPRPSYFHFQKILSEARRAEGQK